MDIRTYAATRIEKSHMHMIYNNVHIIHTQNYACTSMYMYVCTGGCKTQNAEYGITEYGIILINVQHDCD